jgi:hypothetical protein
MLDAACLRQVKMLDVWVLGIEFWGWKMDDGYIGES